MNLKLDLGIIQEWELKIKNSGLDKQPLTD